MKLLVEEILKLDAMKNAKIIAGRDGLKNTLTFAAVMDVPDIIKWLRGGEILFTAGLFEKCKSEEFFLQLYEKKVSAVITKHNYAIKLEENLKRFCDKLCLPIISVEQDTAWSDITNSITELIARKQYNAIYQSQLFHAALIRALLQGESFSQLCDDVFNITRLETAVMDLNFSLLGYSKDIDWGKALNNFNLYLGDYRSALAMDIDGIVTAGYVYKDFFLRSIGKQIFIFPISQNDIVCSYIAVLVNLDVECLDITDSMKISQFSLIVLLTISKHFEIENVSRKYYNLLLDRILYGDMSNPRECNMIENTMNQVFHESYHIVLAYLTKMERKTDLIDLNHRISRLFKLLEEDALDFEDILSFEKGDNLVFFLHKVGSGLKETIEKLQVTIETFFKGTHVFMGISELVKKTDLQQGFKQATQALQFIKSHSNKTICYYEDLGVLRFFMDNSGNIDKVFLRDVKKKFIDPLRDYDYKNNTQLEKTLYCFIENGCSNLITQKILFIHKNTLRARLLRIEKILGCSLKNNEDMFNIQLAMKIDYCFSE